MANPSSSTPFELAIEKTIFIQGLNEQVLEDDVKWIFQPWGEVEHVHLLLSPLKQKNGCGFVLFSDAKVAELAILVFNDNYTMRGCTSPLSVRFAHMGDRERYGVPLVQTLQSRDEDEVEQTLQSHDEDEVEQTLQSRDEDEVELRIVTDEYSRLNQSSFQFNADSSKFPWMVKSNQSSSRFNAYTSKFASRKRKWLSECTTFKPSLEPDDQINYLFKHLPESPKTPTLNEEMKKVIREQTDESSPSTSFVGKLKFTYDGIMIDLEKSDILGIMIPTNTDKIYHMSSKALFILYVEKHDIYSTLAHREFYNRFPCVIVNGPRTRKVDYRTWSFMYYMKKQLNLPVLALVDCNPYSLKKLSVYGFGLYDIKWLGLRPSDIDKYKIPQCSTFPMTKRDIKIAKDLLEDEFVKNNTDWVTELNLMLEKKRKVEGEALFYYGMDFLVEFYLPLKLKELLSSG